MNCDKCPFQKECINYKSTWAENVRCFIAADELFKLLKDYCPLEELIYLKIDEKAMQFLSSKFLFKENELAEES